MKQGLALGCPDCDASFDVTDGPDGCPHHDDRRPALAVRHDYDVLRERFRTPDGTPASLWAYRTLLPIDPGSEPVSLGEGGTPLVPAPTLGADLGVDLSLKLESANPTGSTKDRGSAPLVTEARRRSVSTVACASTGNAAGSTAAYAARADLDCCAFVPGDVPEAKAVQPLVAGADVFAVEGSYDNAAAVCRRVVEGRDWWARSGRRSFLVAAGIRTLAYELLDGLDDVPDWVVVPMGNGGTIAATWRGIGDYERLGLIDRRPRLLGVQARSTSPIHAAFTGEGSSARGTESEETCADGIAVARPNEGEAALSALEGSHGATVAVSDEAIRWSIETLGSAEGLFAEPASAAVVAGLRAAREDGTVDPGERVVAVVTGDGLNDPTPAIESAADPVHVPADVDVEDVDRARE